MPEQPLTLEQQMIAAGRFLMQQFIDAKTIGETLRLLLIERGVFSDEEYLKKYQHVSELLQKDINEKTQHAAELLLLRNFKGPAH